MIWEIVGFAAGALILVMLIAFCAHVYRFMYKVPRALETIAEILENRNAKDDQKSPARKG